MTKVQYNPNTLKAIYDAVANKQQVVAPNVMVSECAHCVGTQPAWINITFTGLADIGCCDGAGGVADDDYAGFAAAANGTFKVLHLSGCIYQTDFSVMGDAISHEYHSTDGSCTGLSKTFDEFEYLRITVTLEADGISIAAFTWTDEYGGPLVAIFVGKILYTGDDECGDTSNTENTNDITDCEGVGTLGYGHASCPNTGVASASLT